MKKYFSYLSMALIAFVFASCGLKGITLLVGVHTNFW